MTNKEILEKAIEKAVKNGYCKDGVTTTKNEAHWYYETHSFYQVIFSHEFAKYFFGSGKLICYGCDNAFYNFEEFLNHEEKFNCSTSYGYNHAMNWKQHLGLMVLEKEPLKYLEGFLEIPYEKIY